MKPEELQTILEAMKEEKAAKDVPGPPSTLFGIPTAYLSIGVFSLIAFWFIEQNRGKSPYEVQVGQDITEIKSDIQSITDDVGELRDDIKEVRAEAKERASAEIQEDLTDVKKPEYLRDLQKQAEIDAAQWQAIREIRNQQTTKTE